MGAPARCASGLRCPTTPRTSGSCWSGDAPSAKDPDTRRGPGSASVATQTPSGLPATENPRSHGAPARRSEGTRRRTGPPTAGYCIGAHRPCRGTPPASQALPEAQPAAVDRYRPPGSRRGTPDLKAGLGNRLKRRSLHVKSPQYTAESGRHGCSSAYPMPGHSVGGNPGPPAGCASDFHWARGNGSPEAASRASRLHAQKGSFDQHQDMSEPGAMSSTESPFGQFVGTMATHNAFQVWREQHRKERPVRNGDRGGPARRERVKTR